MIWVMPVAENRPGKHEWLEASCSVTWHWFQVGEHRELDFKASTKPRAMRTTCPPSAPQSSARCVLRDQAPAAVLVRPNVQDQL
jgi:hypothetical protein